MCSPRLGLGGGMATEYQPEQEAGRVDEGGAASGPGPVDEPCIPVPMRTLSGLKSVRRPVTKTGPVVVCSTARVRQDEGVARIRTKTASGKPATLREFLIGQDSAWLADELLRVADADPLVAARLKAAAGADRAGLVDLSRLRQELDTAILPGGFIEYGAAFGYARGIDSVLDRVEELTNAGFPDAAIEAAEHALSLLEEAFGQVDDSDGELGAIRARAQEIHLAACEAARPDPGPLGERLARWALRSEWEIFLEAPSAYADVLGSAGLARFEAIVDEQFGKLPRLAPGDERGIASWSERFRPTFLKEALAALRGTDEVVEVIAHDLSSSYQFLRAAEVLAADGRVDEALDWLSRGRAAFGETDQRLADMAADLHHRAGRHGQAVDIAWLRFTANPGLGGYQRLKEFASAAGDWPERRQEAVELLRAQPPITGAAPRPGPLWAQPPGHSTLVEVLLWEGDTDAAWDAAQHGGCTWRHWLEVARARAGRHPGEAIPVLEQEILHVIEGAKRSAYHVAAELAKELRGYADRAGRSAEFGAWIRTVRTDNARRRALQDEFDLALLPR
jgi:hypothetical protein